MRTDRTQSTICGVRLPLSTAFLSLRWGTVIWTINALFLLVTVFFAYLPGTGSPDRQGLVQYLAQFTLAEERNLAAYWQGWCLLLVAILAFERFLQSDKTAKSPKQAWLGLSVIGAGLSFDELASIHERAPLLFEPWGFSGMMQSFIPLAIPALAIAMFTLKKLWCFADRRPFWLTLGAFVLFGSVALHEYLEHKLTWPWWVEGVRVGVEEGSELLGIFLLLSIFMTPDRGLNHVKSIIRLAPRTKTLAKLRLPVAFLTLVSFVPLGVFTLFVLAETDVHHRGTPATWLPFMLLNLSSMAAWASGHIFDNGGYRRQFLFISCLGLFFSLDQIIVFERVLDKNLVQGVLSGLMFPCMAAACLAIPSLRTRANLIFLGVLFVLSPLFVLPSELLPWLVVPIQALGIFWVLSSPLAKVSADESE